MFPDKGSDTIGGFVIVMEPSQDGAAYLTAVLRVTVEVPSTLLIYMETVGFANIMEKSR